MEDKTQMLELVHLNICGSIKSISNGGKWYFIKFINYYS